MDIGFLIDGEARPAAGGATYDRNDPYTGKLAPRAAAAGVADVRAAVEAAAAAFKTWSKTGPGERCALLMKAADVMESQVGEFTRLMIEETGGTAPWAGFNVMLAASLLREAGAMTTQIAGEVIPSNNPGITLAMGIWYLAGGVLGIAPWNAPVILGTRAIAMPLACGNTVVLKASESCPGVHRLIGQCLADAGIPRSEHKENTNDPKNATAENETLLAHP